GRFQSVCDTFVACLITCVDIILTSLNCSTFLLSVDLNPKRPSCFHVFSVSVLTEFNSTGPLSLHTRGCLDSDLCGVTLTGTLLGAGYTSSFVCCNTTLCNGATTVQLPLTVALCAAILSFLWGFWEM
uniref:UPAR/Ly6 domain-containing protein n=1 Tax=Acanthochromis polyacanthus TaxID=80966 RepID=A0A3Q1EHT6_9TELE